jgi:hypothetical protein
VAHRTAGPETGAQRELALSGEPGRRAAKFLYFPDEGHWILKPNNTRLWYETVFAFLAHHVLGEEWVRPELL